jgi:hypothetical protein
MWLRIKAMIQKLDQIDPVSGICKRLFLNHPLLAAISVSVILVSVWWILGSYTVAHVSLTKNITGPKDFDEMSFAVFLWGIFVPAIWWYYLSLPKMWYKMVDALCALGLVDRDLFEKAILPKLGKSFFLPSFLLAALVVFLYKLNSVPTEIAHGRISFWFVTPFGNLLICLYVGLNAYVLIGFALKALTLIMASRQYFYTKGIKSIYLFHPDQCGGFASVGNLAMFIASLAVFAGLWATWYLLLPLLAGGQINHSLSVILIYLAYMILVPLLLISLTRPVSQAMRRYKHKEVMRVSKKLQHHLSTIVENENKQSSPDVFITSKKYMEDYENFIRLYENLNAMPESPIRKINLQRFSSIAAVPAILGVLSIAADVFTLLAWFRK